MSILVVGVDPGFRHIGIVAVRGKDKTIDGHVVVDYHKMNYPSTNTDKDTYENWSQIAFEVNESLREVKSDFSPNEAMFIGVLAPVYKPGQSAGKIKLWTATGIIYGICTKWGPTSWKTDRSVRRILGPLIGCPKKFDPAGDATRFIRGTQFKGQRVLWADCPNEHCAHAYLRCLDLVL